VRGYVYQLNCSQGGVPKLPVREADLTRTGLVGDAQAKVLIHGGKERALSLYALELIEQLRAEGHPIYPGSAGENVTVAGLDWSRLAPGARLAIGERVVVEISSYDNPCPTIRGSFADGEYKRISQKLHPGDSRLYARVLRTGRIAVAQQVRVLEADERDALDVEASAALHAEALNVDAEVGASAANGSKQRRTTAALASHVWREDSGAV
jgi:MOSC domain-containing protein YiiM